MITIATASPNIQSEGMTISEMGVSAKRMQKIIGFMRNEVYSDARLAVVREYLSNSLDEHRKHKIDKPVQVGIRKTDEGHEFFVRDFALGLSDNGIRNVFAMSGESTKDDNNDDIGGFGIGAKCGLSYSGAFFVHSYFEGIKTVYSFVLGSNSEGEEVGLVYDLDRSPTTETGIEVVVNLKEGDTGTFWRHIRNFVAVSPHNISGSFGSLEVFPSKTKASFEKNGFSIRSLENPDGEYANKKIIQMGGVVYKAESLDVTGTKILSGHSLVINMPVGTCSPALSRESLQVSAKTDKAMAEIQLILQNLAIEDLSQFKTKTVLELVNDSLSAMTAYQGEFFQTSAANLYKSVWNFVEATKIHNHLLPAEKKNDKPICVIIPNNDARGYWREKVKNYLRDSARNVYIVAEGPWSSGDLAITDSFELVSARKLPYPKILKINGRFTVYERTRRRTASIGKFNAIEFFNYVSNKFNWKFTATTEKEVSDFISKKVSEVNSNDELREVSFSVSDLGCDCHFSINSAAFSDKLESSGFIVARGDIWSDIFKKLEAVRQESAQKNQIFSSAKKEFVTYLPKTTEAIKKVRHADRVSKFWSAILKENSLRGKILQQFNKRYSYDCVKINRQELRKILALK